MGCCVSADKKIPAPPPPHLHRHSSFSKSSRAPPPPPPLEEEETVKEVLSETPILKIQDQPIKFPPKHFLHEKVLSETPILKIQDQPVKFPPKHFLHEIQPLIKNNDVKKPISISPNPTAEEVSEEVSEICSTRSESVSTAMVNEKRDNDVSDEVRHKSPGKYRNRSVTATGDLRRERAVGKSPARGSEQSPGRVRSMNGRAPRIVEARGESSVPGQRSRSPVNRTAGNDGSTRNAIGRRPSLRKTGKSLSRVGSDLNRRGEGGKWGEPTSRNESLESPLVSLECFIFL